MNRVTPLDTQDVLEVAPHLQALVDRGGTIPTSLHVLARRPGVLNAFGPFFNSIMTEGGVPNGLKQLIAHVVSRSAGCLYCQAHTGHFAHTLAGESFERVEAVWAFETSELFNEAERAALRLARDSGIQPNSATDEHFDELKRYWSESEIVEIVSVISMFGFLNRFNDTLANELEPDAVQFSDAHLAQSGWTVGKHG